MRKKIVAGNWKMNYDLSETEALLAELKTQFPKTTETTVIVAPPFTNLYPVFQSLQEMPINVAAQNMHQNENGAFTGEVSAKMLKSVGVETVILGHSERRSIFKETNELLQEKVEAALKNGLKIIFCVGEELNDRKNDTHFEWVKTQLSESLFQLVETDWENLTIAYEPIWAIGTGETALPEQAQEMHAFIRKTLSEKYDDALAEKVSILYGGSVKPNNAREIFVQTDVDGGLIGGASLKAADFLEIVNAF